MKTLLIFSDDQYVQRMTNKDIPEGVYTQEDITAVVCNNLEEGLELLADFDIEMSGAEACVDDYVESKSDSLEALADEIAINFPEDFI